MNTATIFLSLFLITACAMAAHCQDKSLPKRGDKLSDEQVVAFAKLALSGINQEFPNKPSNVMASADSVQSPAEMHPVFYGCFDWHSSVHGHWMLVRLLRLYPDNSRADEIRRLLDKQFDAADLEKEAEYFRAKHNRSFERMYGWAWLLRLVAELESWPDPDAKRWRENLSPLENIIVQKTMDYVPLLSFPIRTGVHPDTGFALGQTLDYARVVNNRKLEELVVERAKAFFLNDKNYPAAYEPSGEDFFSSGLNEADLMRRVLPADEFAKWLEEFFPSLATGKVGNLFVPVEVSDVTDGKIVHLAGLDLSRGWCLQSIAAALPQGDARVPILEKSADEHARMGLRYVFSGHYEGEHWLATFAIYMLTGVGIEH